MATTGAAVTLTGIGTPTTIPAPSLGSDFAAVQIQNSSVFVISVLAGGETYTLQPFVAQTLPLANDAAPIVVTPLQNPGAESTTFATLTPVWLLTGEAPPMQDGPLTAAALAAIIGSQGIGSLVFTEANPLVDQVVAIPANTRTIIVQFVTPLFDAETPNLIQITGGINYYNQPPYLISSQGNIATVVVPISSPTSSSVVINWTWPGGTLPLGGFTLNVYADTAEYEESIFYNGVLKTLAQTATAPGNYTVITGPARLLGFDLSWATGALFNVTLAGTTIMALNPAPAGGIVTKAFPAGVILEEGQTLVLTTGNADLVTLAAEWAYP